MQAAQIPTKFPMPFANNAGASFINPIPTGSQIGVVAGAASLTDGFPPVTFLPVNAGGTPPWGRDFNGLLNQITAWNRWQAAGGMCLFDASFAAAIGGYPQNSLIASLTPGNAWMSLIDNNLVDPNATPGAPGWAAVAYITPVQNGAYISADDTGSADNYVSSPVPAPVSYAKYQKFQVKIANANLTTTPTLNITGATGTLLGAKVIINQDGSALAVNALTPGMIAGFIYDGVHFQLEGGRGAGSGGGGGFGGFRNQIAYTVAGNYTFVVPAGVSSVWVEGWGGGGAFTGSTGAGTWFRGPAPVTPGQVIPVVVGAGGNPGDSTNLSTMTPGGASSFGNYATAGGALVTAGPVTGTPIMPFPSFNVTGQIIGGYGPGALTVSQVACGCVGFNAAQRWAPYGMQGVHWSGTTALHPTFPPPFNITGNPIVDGRDGVGGDGAIIVMW